MNKTLTQRNKTLTQRSRFECSYLMPTLDDRKGTYVLNSHSYLVEVVVEVPDSLVITFEQLKAILDANLFDKQFLYNSESDDAISEIVKCLSEIGVPCTGFDDALCAESIADRLAHSVCYDLACEGVQLVELKLKENSNSFVTVRVKP